MEVDTMLFKLALPSVSAQFYLWIYLKAQLHGFSKDQTREL